MRPGGGSEASVSDLTTEAQRRPSGVIESTYHQSPLVVAMQRTSLRVRAFDRASRSDTLLPIQASNTTFRTTAEAHQNRLTTPHQAPVSPIPKGRAIEVRGHRA